MYASKGILQILPTITSFIFSSPCVFWLFKTYILSINYTVAILEQRIINILAVPGLRWCPMDSVAVEVEGHVTVVRFWGSPERGAPVVNDRHVSVWEALMHSVPSR